MKTSSPQCGAFGFYPRILQRLLHPATYLVFYSLVGLMQGAYYTYLVGISNTLEKRFAMPSRISSVMNMADNIAPIAFGAVIGHYASNGHRPRWTAFAMFVSSAACALAALPYFLYGPGNDYYDDDTQTYIDSTEDDIEYCARNRLGSHPDNGNGCSNAKKLENMPSIIMIFFSNFLTGIVTTIYYSAGTAYMDDNVPREQAPLYMTTAAFLRGLGPALGFVLSSACLYLYEDPSHPPDYRQDDPRWVGAWWLGFVILAASQSLLSIPLLMFPKRMKAVENATVTFKKSGMKGAFLRLLRNPIYVFNLVSEVLKLFGILGYFNFQPKYLQEQFHVSASSASLYGGSLPISISLVAAFVGGVALRYWKPNPRLLTFMMFVSEIATVTLLILLMRFKCATPNYAIGHDISRGSGGSMYLPCNIDCGCSLKVFHPVCMNGATFFSPCFAGCGSQPGPTNGTEEYPNCTCAGYSKMENFTSQSRDQAPGNVSVGTPHEGHCRILGDECHEQYRQYLIVLTLAYCVSFVFQTARILLPMRCVDSEDKTFSLAIFQGAIALFAFIPYPLVFSHLVDSTCNFWEESCSSKGNCWVYNIDLFNQTIHLTAALLYLLGSFFFFFVFILSGSSRLDHFYDEDNHIQMLHKTRFSLK